MRQARELGHVCVLGLLMAVACGPSRNVRQGAPGSAPREDGEKVIKYDVDVVEDDSDCHANVPYKRSTETMTVEWYTDRDVTMFVRGGLYQKDLTLDDKGEYTEAAAEGPCLVGSNVWGRLNKEEGQSVAVCKKHDCTVRVTSTAHRHGTNASPDGGMTTEDGGAP